MILSNFTFVFAFASWRHPWSGCSRRRSRDVLGVLSPNQEPVINQTSDWAQRFCRHLQLFAPSSEGWIQNAAAQRSDRKEPEITWLLCWVAISFILKWYKRLCDASLFHRDKVYCGDKAEVVIRNIWHPYKSKAVIWTLLTDTEAAATSELTALLTAVMWSVNSQFRLKVSPHFTYMCEGSCGASNLDSVWNLSHMFYTHVVSHLCEF